MAEQICMKAYLGLKVILASKFYCLNEVVMINLLFFIENPADVCSMKLYFF